MRIQLALSLCLVLADAELDVTLVRNLSGGGSSECHALSDSGSVALEWLSILNHSDERYIQMHDYHERHHSDDGCNVYGIFCQPVRVEGWEDETSMDVDVPPFTDVRWESLQTVKTLSSSKFEENKYRLTVPTLYLSLKGTGMVDVHFTRSSDSYSGGYIVELSDETLRLFKCSPVDLSCNREPELHTMSTELFNLQRWSHLYVRFRNNAIIVGAFSGNGREEEIFQWENRSDVHLLRHVAFRSNGLYPFLWRIHRRAFLRMSGNEGIITGTVNVVTSVSGRRSLCLSFWYFMTSGSNATLTVKVGNNENFINAQNLSSPSEWKRYVEEYWDLPLATVEVLIKGNIPPGASGDTIVAVDDFRKCGNFKDISHWSTVPALEPWCAPTFQALEIKNGSCKRDCSGQGTCYNDRCECLQQAQGPECQLECPDNRFGKQCGGRLASYGGFLLCNVLTRDCVCQSGFSGSSCTTRCGPGLRRANCTEVCTNCAVKGACDPNTLSCFGGCTGGYRPPKCLYLPSYLVTPPTLTETGAYFLTIDILFGQSNYFGQGVPINYMVQYRQADNSTWNSEGLLPINQNNKSASYSSYFHIPHRITDLQPGRKYDVRVLLQDDDMSINTDVRHLTFQTCTPNPNPPSYLRALHIRESEWLLQWERPVPIGPHDAQKYCPIQSYDVVWSVDGQDNATFNYRNNMAWISIRNVSRRLQFKVRGVSADSTTPFSQWLFYSINKTECPSGFYGPACEEKCGQCLGQKSCDADNGKCVDGCDGNYRPPLCLLPPSYLLHQPILLVNSPHSIVLEIRLGSDNYQGEGDPDHYQVQYRKAGDSEWNVGALLPTPQGQEDVSVSYNISGLEEKTLYDVRVVLRDTDLAMNTNVTHSKFETCKLLLPGNVSVTQTTSTSISLEWVHSSDASEGICSNTEYLVKYVSTVSDDVGIVSTTNTSVTVDDLAASVRFQITICTVYEETTLNCSDTLTVTTLDDGHKADSQMKTAQTGNSSVAVIVVPVVAAVLVVSVAFTYFAVRNKWFRSVLTRASSMTFSILSQNDDDGHGETQST